MNIVGELRQYLASQVSLTSLLGVTESWPTWIWTWKPAVHVDGTGKIGLLIYQQGHWVPPSLSHSIRHPRICAEAWTSPTVGEDGNILHRDAETRGLKVLDVLDGILHRPQGGILLTLASGLRLTESHRLSEPEPYDIPESDGSKLLRVYYGVTVC